jgi:hypothetical protein
MILKSTTHVCELQGTLEFIALNFAVLAVGFTWGSLWRLLVKILLRLFACKVHLA